MIPCLRWKGGKYTEETLLYMKNAIFIQHHWPYRPLVNRTSWFAFRTNWFVHIPQNTSVILPLPKLKNLSGIVNKCVRMF